MLIYSSNENNGCYRPRNFVKFGMDTVRFIFTARSRLLPELFQVIAQERWICGTRTFPIFYFILIQARAPLTSTD